MDGCSHYSSSGLAHVWVAIEQTEKKARALQCFSLSHVSAFRCTPRPPFQSRLAFSEVLLEELERRTVALFVEDALGPEEIAIVKKRRARKLRSRRALLESLAKLEDDFELERTRELQAIPPRDDPWLLEIREKLEKLREDLADDDAWFGRMIKMCEQPEEALNGRLRLLFTKVPKHVELEVNLAPDRVFDKDPEVLERSVVTMHSLAWRCFPSPVHNTVQEVSENIWLQVWMPPSRGSTLAGTAWRVPWR